MESEVFDIYLDSPVAPEELLRRLVQSGFPFPENWTPQPGFQQFDFTEKAAADLVEVCLRNRIAAYVIPRNYRQPVISQQRAYHIAQQEVERSNRSGDVLYDDLLFAEEEGKWWKFVAPSEELQERGMIPGAWFIRVDKLDGHIATPEEVRGLYSTVYVLEAATEESPSLLLDRWISEFGFSPDKDYLDNNRPVVCKDGLMVSLRTIKSPGFFGKKHGLTCNLLAEFRIIPHKAPRGSSLALMMKLVSNVTGSSREFILLRDSAAFEIVSLRKNETT